jgi:hypothetical protein
MQSRNFMSLPPRQASWSWHSQSLPRRGQAKPHRDDHCKEETQWGWVARLQEGSAGAGREIEGAADAAGWRNGRNASGGLGRRTGSSKASNSAKDDGCWCPANAKDPDAAGVY